MADERLLRVGDVAVMVGLSGTEIYRRIARGTFPAPIQIAPRVSRWMHTEVQGWIAEQVASCPRSNERRTA